MVDTKFSPSSLFSLGGESLSVAQGLCEVNFNSQARVQSDRADHPLAMSEAKIQFIEGARESRHHVLNICLFAVSAYVSKLERYVTVQLAAKELPGLDNLTAGVAAPDAFWCERSLRSPAETMRDFWRSAGDALVADAVGVVERVSRENQPELERRIREELRKTLQQSVDLVVTETAKEVQLRLASAES